MKHRGKKKCSVPGCKRSGKFLVAKRRQLAPEIRMCKHHKRRNSDGSDTFSIWSAAPLAFVPPQKIILVHKRVENQSPPKKGARKGKDARRTLFTAWKNYDCTHPYSKVRWDVVYKVARCMRCGASVKRSKKNRDKYITKKNQKNKPVIDSAYYKNKKITLGMAVNMMLFQRGIIDLTWEDCVDVVRAIRPGTKFNSSCFSWYRNHFVKTYMTKEINRGKKNLDRRTKRN